MRPFPRQDECTPLMFDSSPFKNDGWKTFAFSFGARQIFRGLLFFHGVYDMYMYIGLLYGIFIQNLISTKTVP